MTPRAVPLIKADLPPLEALEGPFREILTNGRITNFGRYVQQLEKEAGAYLGGTNAVCLSSATAGLIMTLQALDLPKGSHVALPSFSFVATAQAVLYAGCTPEFVDIRADGNADPADLARTLDTAADVRAIILVHMYGLPCAIDEVTAVVRHAEARRGHRIPIIYDAAHAFGSSRQGQRVGGFGDAEVFSTSVTKLMTSVEGGIVASRNQTLIDRLKKMRNYGIESHYNAHYPGLNGKMSEFHALVGLYNLARLDQLLAARATRAAFYATQLRARTSCQVLLAPDGVVSTYKDFTIVLPDSLRAHRDAIIAFLAERGIETRAYFHPPIHEQRFFRPFAHRALPVTEEFSRRVITLPFFSTITDDEMTTVVDALVAAEARFVESSPTVGVRA